MSAFSSEQILQGLVEGQIFCLPLRIENVQCASIDLTLGENFWRCSTDSSGVLDPHDLASLESSYEGPMKAQPYAQAYEKLSRRISRCSWPRPVGEKYWVQSCGDVVNHWATAESPFAGIPDDWPVIVILPGERLLVHTHEFIGINPPRPPLRPARDTRDWGDEFRHRKGGTVDIHTYVVAGRVNLSLDESTDHRAHGIIERKTLVAHNSGAGAVVLPVGRKVASATFHETGGGYVAECATDKDLESAVMVWSPESMIARTDFTHLASTRIQSYRRTLHTYTKRVEKARAAELKRLHRIGSDSVI